MVARPRPRRRGQLLVRHVIARQVILEPLRLFDRIEVAALDVLDEGGFEDLLIVEVHDGDGHAVQSRFAGGPQPALAGHELKAFADLPHDQRLQDAVSADAGTERGKFVAIEGLARLIRVLLDSIDRDLRLYTGRCNAAVFGAAQERIETPTQPRFLVHVRFPPRAPIPHERPAHSGGLYQCPARRTMVLCCSRLRAEHSPQSATSGERPA